MPTLHLKRVSHENGPSGKWIVLYYTIDTAPQEYEMRLLRPRFREDLVAAIKTEWNKTVLDELQVQQLTGTDIIV